MATVKVGKSCSRTPRKPESGGESAVTTWRGVDLTIRMVTVKVGKSCSRTPRKPESGGESAGNRWKGVETRSDRASWRVGEVHSSGPVEWEQCEEWQWVGMKGDERKRGPSMQRGRY